MQSFLSKVTAQILSEKTNISKYTFILPSKRSGLFLKTELKKKITDSVIFPNILSIEEFIAELSGMDTIENIPLIFEFYTIYRELSANDPIDPFDVFSKWAHILINDFNEIDSNLIDADKILTYISDSKRIENWDLENEEMTDLTQNYLKFFEKIKTYYKGLQSHLLEKKLGYQGLLYKKAYENTSDYLDQERDVRFIFIGFNALNKAEENIIHEFLKNKKAEIYWDIDDFYLKNNTAAGKFFNQYKNNWTYYKSNTINWTDNNLNSAKKINIHGIPKNITQIKKVSGILDQLKKDNNALENTAVVLANEKLLPILLNSLPKEIKSTNITMGYALQNIPLANLFELVFKLHLNIKKFDKKGAFYYKDFLSVLKHPVIHNLWFDHKDLKKNLDTLILHNKTLFITQNDIRSLTDKDAYLIELFTVLFQIEENNFGKILPYFLRIIDYLQRDRSINFLEKEYLYRFNNVFQQIANLNNEFDYIKDLKTLYQFYKQILKTENLSFRGEPLKGLQIMGLLESRVLDFDNVIITSVNEGFLPSGNTQNSFIPFDIKLEKGLPTYQEKDAIFAYHFFRLLQRAKNVYILYNTETDDFGTGEQSRFITQLEMAKENNALEKVSIEKNIVLPKFSSDQIPLKEIYKTDSLMHRLEEIATEGFSPSSLGLYLRNPIDYYSRKVLKLKETLEVEETIAANTFGTIIHDTLEILYTPLIDQYITEKDILNLKRKLDDEVTNQFKIHYSLKAIASGKNYLTYEIAKQFLSNFLNYELSELKKFKKIRIIALERSLKHIYTVRDLPFTVLLKGHIDRIDEVGGVLRIVDYKTGKVDRNQLKINDWELLSSDEKYSKSLQVLFYAYLYIENNNIDLETRDMESGIISFKNLKEGFMSINNSTLDKNDIKEFLNQLDRLILEIYDQEVPFREKEIKKYY